MDIIHDKDNHRFILPIDENNEAEVDYTIGNDGVLRLVHSEVPYNLRGQGVGKELVLKTFQKLTDEGYKATAYCSYIRAVASRDPKWSQIIKH